MSNKEIGVNIRNTILPIEELHFSFITFKFRTEFGYIESSRDNIPKDGSGKIMPLVTYPCYEYINSIDWSQAKVFEYGSGFSTLWWKSTGADVYGVDDSEEWHGFTKNKNTILEKNLDKYPYAIEKFDHRFDVIVLDGKRRYDCVKPAFKKLNRGGMIILDNSDWYTNTKEFMDASSLSIPVHFHGFKPLHVEAETTSCYLDREFNNVPRNILPMGGTKRKQPKDDFPKF